MVWKNERDAYLVNDHELVEVVQSSVSPAIKIHFSASSFEVVYEDKPNNDDSTTSIEKDRVRFAPQNQYFKVWNRDDISPKEKQSMWFRKSELKRMRKAFQEKHVDEEYLESNLVDPPQNDELQEALHQLMAISVVLDEQKRQRELNINDPELLSKKYHEFVMRSRRSMFLSNLVREQEAKESNRQCIWGSSERMLASIADGL